MSVSSDGVEATGLHSGFAPSLSGDGGLVAFAAEASNLVEGDGNEVGDIFVRDRKAGTTRRVSVASDGTEADGISIGPSISADGSVVVFASDATNLAADESGGPDLFAHDLATGVTEQVSVSSDGTGGNALSGANQRPGISADGRYVVFQSFADNLVEGDTNGLDDVFLRDRRAGTTTLVSVGLDGPADGPSFGPTLSADGRWATFVSLAANLVETDTNDGPDQFVVDLVEGSVELVSVTPDSDVGSGSVGLFSGSDITDDGRYIAFVADDTDLVEGDTNSVPDVFVRDRVEGTTERIAGSFDGTQSNGESGFPVLADGGRLVLFESVASNLVDGDDNGLNDVFLYDRVEGSVDRVGIMFDPLPGKVSRDEPRLAETFLQSDINPAGTIIAFFSEATTIIDNDTNDLGDAFVVPTSFG